MEQSKVKPAIIIHRIPYYQAIHLKHKSPIVLLEANLHEKNIKNINGEFPDYDIHRKSIPRSQTSKIAVPVKKQGGNIQRVTNIEDPSTTCMWFKMQLANQIAIIAAWYRQWNHLADVAQNYTDGLDGQIERISNVNTQILKVKAISKHIIILGNINIDMSEALISRKSKLCQYTKK